MDPSEPSNVTTQHVLLDHDGAVVAQAPRLKSKVVKPDPRCRPPFDMTGLYEAIPELEQNSKCILHLNQFGFAVVGWLSSPPDWVETGGRAAIPSAVLIADVEKKTARGYPFWCRRVGDSSTWDPTAVLSTIDPEWVRGETPPSGVILGYLDITSERLRLDFDKPHSYDVVLERVNTAPRMSSLALGHQIPSLQRTLRGQQIHPVPASYFDISKQSGAAWKEALNRFEPEGRIAKFVRHYVLEHSGAAKAAALKEISDLLTFPWDRTAQEGYLNILLIKHIMAQDDERAGLSVGGDTGAPEYDAMGGATGRVGEGHAPETRSVLEWLSIIAIDDQRVRGDSTVPPKNFMKVMAGAVVYRYTLTFSSAVLATPPYRLSAAVGIFEVGISVDQAHRGPDGTPGKFTPVQGKSVAGFMGHFMEFKAGLDAPPQLPAELMMYSGALLDPEKELRGATFAIASLEAQLSASAGFATPVMKVGGKVAVGGKTQIMQLYPVGGHVVLEGVYDDLSVTPSLKWDNKAKLDWDKIKGIAKEGAAYKDALGPSYPKKKHLSDPKAAHKYIQAGGSLGLGLLWGGYELPAWRRAPPLIEDKSVRLKSSCRTVAALFEFDKSDLAAPLKGWKRRFLLQIVMATEAALFEGPCFIEVRGYSSPEGTPAHNRQLSQDRADVVMQDIRNVRDIPDGLWDAIGLGELGHDPDPPGDPIYAKIWREEYSAEKAHWARARKAEIWARGRPVVKILTTDSSET